MRCLWCKCFDCPYDTMQHGQQGWFASFGSYMSVRVRVCVCVCVCVHVVVVGWWWFINGCFSVFLNALAHEQGHCLCLCCAVCRMCGVQQEIVIP